MNENFYIPSSCSLFNIKNVYNELVARIGYDGFDNLITNPEMKHILMDNGSEKISGFNSNIDLVSRPITLDPGDWFNQELSKLNNNEVYSLVIDFKTSADFNLKFSSTSGSEIVDENGEGIDVVIPIHTDDLGDDLRQQVSLTFFTGLYNQANPGAILFTALTNTTLEIYNIAVVKGTFAVDAQKNSGCFTDYVRYNNDGTDGFYEVSMDGVNYNRIFTSSPADIASFVNELNLVFYTSSQIDTMFLRKDIPDAANQLITFLDGLRSTGDVSISALKKLILDGNEIVVNNSQIVGSGLPTLDFSINVKRGDMPDVGVRYNETIDRWEYTHDGIDWRLFGSLNVGDETRVTNLETRVTTLEGAPIPIAADVITDSSTIDNSTSTNVQNVLEDLGSAITTASVIPIAADVTANSSSFINSSTNNVQSVLSDFDTAITAAGGIPIAADVTANSSTIDNSTSTNVQNVLEDLGSAITTASVIPTAADVITDSSTIDNSTSTNVQNVLEDLGSAITAASGISTAAEVWKIKTSNYTLIPGDKIIADTSSGIFTLTLPITPSAGNTITILDGKGTFSINNLTVDRNGENILGSTDNLICDVDDVKFSMTYIDVSEGWKVNY